MAGADRWSERKWLDLESQLGLSPPESVPDVQQPATVQERPTPPHAVAGDIGNRPVRRGRRVTCWSG